jgi:hypothetical protein
VDRRARNGDLREWKKIEEFGDDGELKGGDRGDRAARGKEINGREGKVSGPSTTMMMDVDERTINQPE